MRSLFTIIFLIMFSAVFGQAVKPNVDSVEIIFKSSAVDSAKVKQLYFLTARTLSAGEYEKVLKYSPRLIALAKKLPNPKWYAETLRFYAVCFEKTGHADSAIKYYNRVLDVARKNNLRRIEGHCNHNMGMAYYAIGALENALKSYLEALKIREELHDTVSQGWTQNNIGLIYWRQKSRNDALTHFRVAKELFGKKKYNEGLAIAISNIGLINEETGHADSAIYYYKESTNLNVKENNKYGLALNLNNIGGIYSSQNEVDSAEKYFQNSLAINADINNLEGLELNYRNLSEVKKKQKRYKEALDYINRAIKIAVESKQPQGLIADYDRLSEIYALMGDYKMALEAHKKYAMLNDSLNFGDKLANMEALYGKEKNEKQIALLKSENEVNELQLKRKQYFIYTAAAGFILLIIIIFFIVKNNLERKKANRSLAQKNDEIVKQKEIIEEKSKDITDSILYAKRIQDAVLPDSSDFEKCFREHLIIFKPRDIVSGDFYWLAQVEEHILLILADCTGHGVPGAFMSIIGHDILNQVIKEEKHFDPAVILSLLDERLFAVLNKKKGASATNDGMDISVCCINTKDKTLKYGGAGRPLVMVENKVYTLVAGDKTSVGGQRTSASKQFTTHSINYNTGQVFYLMSDGFPDQFGGPKGKKYKSKQLYDLFSSIASLPLNEQKEQLNEVFNTWKGALEQVDDVCVIGFRM